ncbi:head-tail connector protein [Thermoanaerobacterium sp. RBIITD]|uniref:head-tail connector protein n=1 Tax=Thermoanaerobacterium sp. RBIITD TaxID=1550240 RepID=UPI000BB7EAEE|nr:head-tail connector protein [Thermoanaerobacterium sp. RBIITD]
MNLILIEGPELEPVSLEEAKLHLRVDGTEEDALISALISTAREFCESFTGRSLALQTFEYISGPFFQALASSSCLCRRLSNWFSSSTSTLMWRR